MKEDSEGSWAWMNRWMEVVEVVQGEGWWWVDVFGVDKRTGSSHVSSLFSY